MVQDQIVYLLHYIRIIKANENQVFIGVFELIIEVAEDHSNGEDNQSLVVDFGKVLDNWKNVIVANDDLVINKIKNLSNFESESSSTKSKNGWSIKNRKLNKFLHINMDLSTKFSLYYIGGYISRSYWSCKPFKSFRNRKRDCGWYCRSLVSKLRRYLKNYNESSNKNISSDSHIHWLKS